MTVKELIEILKESEPDAVVVIDGDVYFPLAAVEVNEELYLSTTLKPILCTILIGE